MRPCSHARARHSVSARASWRRAARCGRSRSATSSSSPARISARRTPNTKSSGLPCPCTTTARTATRAPPTPSSPLCSPRHSPRIAGSSATASLPKTPPTPAPAHPRRTIRARTSQPSSTMESPRGRARWSRGRLQTSRFPRRSCARSPRSSCSRAARTWSAASGTAATTNAGCPARSSPAGACMTTSSSTTAARPPPMSRGKTNGVSNSAPRTTSPRATRLAPLSPSTGAGSRCTPAPARGSRAAAASPASMRRSPSASTNWPASRARARATSSCASSTRRKRRCRRISSRAISGDFIWWWRNSAATSSMRAICPTATFTASREAATRSIRPRDKWRTGTIGTPSSKARAGTIPWSGGARTLI